MNSVHIGLAATEAIHLDWIAGAPMPETAVPAAEVGRCDLTPKNVTAALVGLKSRAVVIGVQRWMSDYEGEPLRASLSGVALDELWGVVGIGGPFWR